VGYKILIKISELLESVKIEKFGKN